MKKRTLFIMSLLIVSLLLISCTAADQLEESTGDQSDKQEELTGEQNDGDEVNEGKIFVVKPAIKGNSVTVSVGDRIEVQLPANPIDDGFVWMVQSIDNSILEQVGMGENISDISTPSAGGFTTLVFKAVGVGKTNPTLILAKASAAEVPSMFKQSFGMEIIVE